MALPKFNLRLHHRDLALITLVCEATKDFDQAKIDPRGLRLVERRPGVAN